MGKQSLQPDMKPAKLVYLQPSGQLQRRQRGAPSKGEQGGPEAFAKGPHGHSPLLQVGGGGLQSSCQGLRRAVGHIQGGQLPAGLIGVIGHGLDTFYHFVCYEHQISLSIAFS